MATRQQQEALEYFSRFAADWRRKAEGGIPEKVNIIRQRNDYVLRVAAASGSVERALDVGCGTGDLVCALARAGVAHAVGIDFAAEMIALSRERARTEGVPGAEFVHASVFDYDPGEMRFDLAAANGFIEYISEGELVDFLHRMGRLLAPGGTLAMGSRNRLFNAFSLNEYTRIEIENGAVPALVAEATLIAEAASCAEAIERLAVPTDALPRVDRHPTTGVRVATRHQYTPGELVRLLRAAGFTAIGMEPVHYHGAPPRFRRLHPAAHIATAELMQEYAAECHCLIPFASSLMLHATRSRDA